MGGFQKKNRKFTNNKDLTCSFYVVFLILNLLTLLGPHKCLIMNALTVRSMRHLEYSMRHLESVMSKLEEGMRHLEVGYETFGRPMSKLEED